MRFSEPPDPLPRLPHRTKWPKNRPDGTRIGVKQVKIGQTRKKRDKAKRSEKPLIRPKLPKSMLKWVHNRPKIIRPQTSHKRQRWPKTGPGYTFCGRNQLRVLWNHFLTFLPAYMYNPGQEICGSIPGIWHAIKSISNILQNNAAWLHLKICYRVG